MNSMILKLIEKLRNIGLRLTAEEMADVIWLASILDEPDIDLKDDKLSGDGTDRSTKDGADSNIQKKQAQTASPHSDEKTTGSDVFLPISGTGIGTNSGPGLGGLTFQSPSTSALPGKLEIGRSLRPLMRLVPSRTKFILDEEATAQRIADEKNWIPVFRPAPSRWLDALLVVDESPSMVIWKRTIQEWYQLLERQGAFRNIRILSLYTNTKNGDVRLGVKTDSERSQCIFQNPSGLIDPRGQRLILVITDCVSPAWYQNRITGMLSNWGLRGLVVLVQVLPSRLWKRTALGQAVPIHLRSLKPGMSNINLEVKLPWYSSNEALDAGFPIPVVTLEPRSLHSWANLVAGLGNKWTTGRLLPQMPPPDLTPFEGNQKQDSPSPGERVKIFRAAASPTARKLAGYLSIVPLSLPIMHLVQKEMLPDSRQPHLAEVFLGGLIKRKSPEDPSIHPNDVQYDFFEGVRDYLLSTVLVSETVETIAKTSNFINRETGGRLDFKAIIADPSKTDQILVETESQPFAHMAIKVLKRLGGRYASLANRLEERIEMPHTLSQEDSEDHDRSQFGLKLETEVIDKSEKHPSENKTTEDSRSSGPEQGSNSELKGAPSKEPPSHDYIYRRDTSVSIAHLSDLHFGKNSRFKGKNLERLGRTWAQAIMAGTEKNFNKPSPNIVVVTGDLTEQGLKDEFEQTAEFFNALCASLGVEKSKFIFLPGNHDVSWEACKAFFKANPDRIDKNYDRELGREKLALFYDFTENFYGGEKPESHDIEPSATLYVFNEYQLCVAAMNSCEPITHKAPLGGISEEQAQAVMDVFRNAYDNYIKIAALHHPVNSDPEKVRAWIEILKENFEKKKRDTDLLTKFENDAVSIGGSEYVTSILKDCQVHLLLHGHQHSFANLKQVKWRERTEFCQICPTGSFGIRPEGLPADQPNCLRLIQLFPENDRLQLKSMTLQYDPLAKMAGSVVKGHFQDLGRIDEASFPLYGDYSLNIIQDLIKRILASSNDFRSALGMIFTEDDDPKELTQALVSMGFERVWVEAVGKLEFLNDHLDALKRVLLLLAQCAIKKEAIEAVRKKLETKDGRNVFNLPIRYPLMAELILKTAINTEIDVELKVEGGRREIIPRNMISLPESVFDGSRKRDYIIQQIISRFPDLRDLPEAVLMESLSDRLEAYFLSNQPYFVVHDDPPTMNIPYMTEFIIPSRKETLPPRAVSNINESKLCELIKIILTTFDGIKKKEYN